MARLREAWADPVTTAVVGAIVLLGAMLVVTPASGRGTVDPPLVVADLRGQALVVVDPYRPQEARRIALPGGPHELVHLPDGRVAVTLEQSGRVALVDLATAALEVHDVGGYPHGIDEHESVLYVTDRTVDAVRRFRLDGWVELAPIAAGGWPHAVRVLPDGRVVSANAADSTLHIGDMVVAASALSETVAIAPGAEQLATAGAYGGHVDVLAVDGSRLARHHVGGRPVRVEYAPDGTLAAALSAAGAVAIIDPAGSMRTVPVGGVPDGLAFSPAGARVYVGDVQRGVVSVVDTSSGELLAQVDVGESAGALLFTR